MGGKADMDLIQALIKGEPERVSDALARGANPNQKLADNGTPLHLAAMFGPPETVKRLIEAGAAIEARDRWGRAPLHWASFSCHDPQVARTLIDAGADIDAKSKSGMTPLDCAVAVARTDTAPMLLKAGAHCSKGNLKWVRRVMAGTLREQDRSRG